MSTNPQPYRVLARAYRPDTFEDLIGQDVMVRTLRHAFAANRIAHAFILTGVRGVGKTTTARILARALNYAREGEPDAGPTLELGEHGLHCTAIAEGRHPDVFEMDAASRTGVADIRELIEGARYAPVSARYKIYIIDEVHMLSTAAFNGLLKTLEEPPPHVKFIFATTEIRKVPVTVLSRCQRFDLRRVPPEELSDYLTRIADKEGGALEAEAAAVLARAAEGSVRDGLSLLDQALASQDTGAAITAGDVRSLLGLASGSVLARLFEAAMLGDAATTLHMAGEAVDSGVEPHMLLRDLAGVCHRVSRAKVAGATRDVSEAEDYSRQIEDLAGKVSLGHISLAWQVLLQAHKETLSAPDPRAALDMGLIKLLHAVSLPDPGRLMAIASGERASGGQAGGQGTTGAPPDAAPVSERAPIGAELEPAMDASAGEAPRATTNAAPLHDQQDLTPILHAIEESRNLQLLEDVKAYVRPVRVTRGHVEFAPAENAPSDLANRMREALNAATGETWMVSISRSDAAGPTPAEQAKAREEAARAQALAHPTVQAILNAFDGAELVLGREATTSKTSDEARDDSHGAVEETPRPSTAQGGTP